MIKIENTDVLGWEHAIRGMRNPLNSWDKSDSGLCTMSGNYQCNDCKRGVSDFCIGNNDLDLMKRLAGAGSDHAKYRRMIIVYADVTAPLYWWKEYDTYKVGTVANSCSTMHKIQDKEFTLEDFSIEHLKDFERGAFTELVYILNVNRIDYLHAKKNGADGHTLKSYWWHMIQLLPSSYNQRRTVQLNYEVRFLCTLQK